MTRRLRSPAILLAIALAVVLAGSTATVLSQNASAADNSAVTKKGDAAFPELEVTISKTRELRNEIVRVTWKGGAPTEPIDGSAMRRNYLQLMQCWGDDPVGPKPEQCTYGGIYAVEDNPGVGSAVRTRQVQHPAGSAVPTDPKESRKANAEGEAYVPFDPVEGDPVGGTFSEFSVYFDYGGTNEIDTARTRANGSGEENFNVQTAAEAPGLGCGTVVSRPGGSKGPRGCWLVVVPRSDREVDGSSRRDGVGAPAEQLLQSSPLSASNWEHRLQFPLAFRPIPEPCAQGGDSTITLGQDSATEAFANWQPLLCTRARTVFDYSEVPDSVGRNKLKSENPSLSIIGAPSAADPVPKDALLAPIAISGMAIAYNWNVQAISTDDEKVRALDGTRMPNGLKLTPRLVLKLLTQSYRLASPEPLHLAPNPASLQADPEFQELNKDILGDLDMADLNRNAPTPMISILTTINPTDINRVLWDWIKADADARSFLAGQDDGHGMRINAAYKNLSPDRDDFPKLDSTCQKFPQNPGQLDVCTLDKFPYAASLAEAARSALRGDTLARSQVWDNTALPPAYKKDAVQIRGKRAMMAFTDTSNAARYDLRVAALRNASGKFVTPTPASMLAAVNAWKKSSVPGVVTPNPMAAGNAVYPLTNISYAAVRPSGSPTASAAQNAAARKAYASFLEYAIGPGQKPGEALGELPTGYVPLPASLVKVGVAAVKVLRNYQAPVTAPPRSTPRPNRGSDGDTPSGGGTSSGGSGSSGSGASTPAPPQTPTGTPVDQPPPVTDPTVDEPVPPPAVPTVTTAITPTSGVGSRARHSLIWVLVAGLAAGAAARILPRVIAARARPDRPGGGAGV